MSDAIVVWTLYRRGLKREGRVVEERGGVSFLVMDGEKCMARYEYADHGAASVCAEELRQAYLAEGWNPTPSP